MVCPNGPVVGSVAVNFILKRFWPEVTLLHSGNLTTCRDVDFTANLGTNYINPELLTFRPWTAPQIGALIHRYVPCDADGQPRGLGGGCCGSEATEEAEAGDPVPP